MARAKATDLAARLSWARAASGLTACDLSVKAGLARSHVSLIESRKRTDIKTRTAQRIARVLGFSWPWLLSGEGEPPTEAQIRRAVATDGA